MGRTLQKRVFGHMRTNQGLHCKLTETLDTAQCMIREQRPRQYVEHVQVYLNLHILNMI